MMVVGDLWPQTCPPLPPGRVTQPIVPIRHRPTVLYLEYMIIILDYMIICLDYMIICLDYMIIILDYMIIYGFMRRKSG